MLLNPTCFSGNSTQELKELDQWKAEDPEKQVGLSSENSSINISSTGSSRVEMPNLISTQERKSEKKEEKSEAEKIYEDLTIQKLS